jgi:hypothetical protein
MNMREASAKLVNRIIPAYVFPRKKDILLIIRIYVRMAGTGFISFGGISKLNRSIKATNTEAAVIKISENMTTGRGMEVGKRINNVLLLIGYKYTRLRLKNTKRAMRINM